MTTMTAEFESLKARLKATWMSGDYGHFAQYLEPGAMDFLARLKVSPGTKMLDVACGAGQIAIPAARSGVRVTGIDIASNLIAQARARAKADGLEVRFDEGDAELLPYADASFDLVVSLIGAMFAPRPERVATEFVRVCRPGGHIVMGNWTPSGLVGQMFRIIGKYAPPPPQVASPLKWGDETTIRERFTSGITKLDTASRMYPIHYPFSPAKVVEFFREYYGPMNRAFAALDTDGQAALRRELDDLWGNNNQARDGSTFVKAEYLEVVATRE